MDIDITLATDIDTLLQASEWDWEVYRGYADRAVQEELYKRYLGGGPLAAKPGRSAHEAVTKYSRPASLAVDIVRVDKDGKLKWDYKTHKAWSWLWQACLEHPRLHSGHLFSHDTNGRVPADDDHIQSTAWPAYKAQLIASGKW